MRRHLYLGLIIVSYSIPTVSDASNNDSEIPQYDQAAAQSSNDMNSSFVLSSDDLKARIKSQVKGSGIGGDGTLPE